MMAEAFVYDPEKAYAGPIRSASGLPEMLDGAPFPFVAVSGRFTTPYSLSWLPNPFVAMRSIAGRHAS